MKKQIIVFGVLGYIIVLVIIFFVIKFVTINVVRNEFEKNEAYTIEDKAEESGDINTVGKAVNKFYNDVIDTKNELRFRKMITVLNSAYTLYWIEDDSVKKLTGEDLANMAVDMIVKHNIGSFENISRKNDTITTPGGVESRFETDGGDCSNGGCYVFIDTNGFDNAPNKIYEGGKPVYDRLRIPITRGKYGVLKIQDPLAELIYKDKQ